jgi:hypothetical protein
LRHRVSLGASCQTAVIEKARVKQHVASTRKNGLFPRAASAQSGNRRRFASVQRTQFILASFSGSTATGQWKAAVCRLFPVEWEGDWQKATLNGLMMFARAMAAL